MRELSSVEINVVSGGMETVVIKGEKQSIDAKNGFSLTSISCLPVTGGAVARIAGEGMGCAVAVNKVKNSPTLTNAATASAACSTVLRDAAASVDWNSLATAVGNLQGAQSNALSNAAQKQNGR